MIAILDYGVGNLFSLRSSLQQLGLQAVVTADADAIRAADRLILPGVGAFGDAMAKLTATGLVPVLKEQAEEKPLLGICLGMQLLFEKSYEYGEHAGLGFIKGEVCPLGPDLADKSLKVPQMGWNALHIVKDDPLFRYIREGEYVYYVHSYYGKNCAESTLAVSDYSIPSPVRCGRGGCTAPSSTRKRAATLGCGSSRRSANCERARTLKEKQPCNYFQPLTCAAGRWCA